MHYWLHEAFHPRGDVINILAKILDVTPAVILASLSMKKDKNQLEMDNSASKEVDEFLIKPMMDVINGSKIDSEQ
jgi:hypothetical protein